MTKNSALKQRAINQTLHIFTKHVLENWRLTLPIVLATTIGTILVFYTPPLIIAAIIQHASDTHVITLQNGLVYLFLFGSLWLLGEMFWRVVFILLQIYEVKALNYFYSLALDNLLQKDLSFFNDRFAGTITKNAIGFGRRFEMIFDTVIFEVVSNTIPAIFALVILSFISPLLSIALVGTMTIGILIVRPLLKRRLSLVKKREEAHSVLAGHISDVVTNIAAVKAHGLEPRELATHHSHVHAFSKAAYESWKYHNTRIDMVVSPVYVLTNVFGLMIILSLGVDNTTKSQLFLAFSYFSTFSRFLWSFNGVYRRLEEAITEAALFVEYTLVEPKIIDEPDAHHLIVSEGKIEFRAVDFTHTDEKAQARAALFDNLNLTIEPGQKLGLVGHSGAGKSSMVSLLERFVNIDGGAIVIDGQNIADVTQESLHQSIAYVPQEPLLFHRSLRDNIAYGKPDATEEEVEQAAKLARAYDFIHELPLGFDTLVGERGVKLSGGQRQRVAIARAILKNAPILVLDEATSALDSESEKLIQESLSDLMKGRTSIVIAHRLSTIAKLDRIVVLDNGKIVEDGTHHELLKQNGTYATLWKHQSGGFISD